MHLLWGLPCPHLISIVLTRQDWPGQRLQEGKTEAYYGRGAIQTWRRGPLWWSSLPPGLLSRGGGGGGGVWGGEPRHHRPVGWQPPWPCSSEPRVPRPNSDAHHFFQFGPFFRSPTHGTMDKRINLELRGRQPAEVSCGLVGFFRLGVADRWGSRWGRLAGPACISAPPAINLPSQIMGRDEKGTQPGHGMGGG